MIDRNVTPGMVLLALNEGETNVRGDRISLTRKRLSSIKGECVDSGICSKSEFDRLYRRNGLTVVTGGDLEITVFYGARIKK